MEIPPRMDALHFRCPQCGAKVGEPCVPAGSWGVPSPPARNMQASVTGAHRRRRERFRRFVVLLSRRSS